MVYGAPFHKTTQRQRNKRLPGTGYDALEFLTTGRGHRGDFVARIRAGIKHAAPVDREGSHSRYFSTRRHLPGEAGDACTLSSAW